MLYPYDTDRPRAKTSPRKVPVTMATIQPAPATGLRTDDFDYELPRELIAQAPAEPRDSCRLLVLDRVTGEVSFRTFTDIVDYLEPGDLLVANETRVLPARLIGHKPGTGGVAECLLTNRREDLDPLGGAWECLVRPGKRLKPGALVEFREGGLLAPMDAPVVLTAEIGEQLPQRGLRLVRFSAAPGLDLDEAMHKAGHVPLPPYITDYKGDPEKYQTVFAMSDEHSAAAPTAGLHFTPELIERLKAKGVNWATVELEVGIDTFRVVEEEDPTEHEMHTERYHVPQDVVDAIHRAKSEGRRVIAVGTTSVRSLESAWDPDARPADPPVAARYFEDAPSSASTLAAGDIVARENATTNLFLMPGSDFHVVDAMVTNFHVPRSTLMMLVSAFAGRERIMDAYQSAIEARFRMLSFGDAMLIL